MPTCFPNVDYGQASLENLLAKATMPGRADRFGVTAATVDGWRKMPLANWVGKAAHFWQLVAAECETGMWPHSAGAARDLGGGAA